MTVLWTILAVAVVLAVVVPGFSRKPTMAGFFLSRREASTQTVAASLVATCLGASATIGMVGRAYTLGWAAFWWLGAGAIGLALLGLVWGPSMRAASGVRTLPQWAETVYGTPARVLASLLIAVMWVAVIAAQWVATAGVMKALFGIPAGVGIALAAAVVSAYTAWGGQVSVLRTDRIQVVLIALAVFTPLFFIGKLAGTVPPPVTTDFAPTSGLQILAVIVVVGGMYVVGPDLCSRVLLARDRDAVKRGALWAGLGVALAGILVTYIGVSIRQAGVQLSSSRQALPWFLSESGVVPLPVGYLINAGLLAATLSSADTCLLTVASVLELDLCGRGHGEERHRLLGRCFVVIAGALAAVVAYWNPRIIPNLLLAYAFYSGGLLMPLLLLRFERVAKRINRVWVWMAMIAGGVLPVWLLLWKALTDYAIAGLWGCLLSGGILLIGWLSSQLGKRKPVA
jgi:SSS family solute:Na+ symporter